MRTGVAALALFALAQAVPVGAKLFERRGVANVSRVLSAREHAAFSGVGRIECPNRAGGNYFSTGFLFGGFDTMLTTAHSFYVPGTSKPIAPSACKAVFYDGRGRAVESVAIVAVASRWSERGLFGDPSNDIAVVRLATRARTPSRILASGTRNGAIANVAVSMIGFYTDTGDSRVLRKSAGAISAASSRLFHYRWSARAKVPFRNGANTVTGDYHASLGSSGAPVLDAAGAVIAMQQGDTVNPSARFDKDNNYNLAILIDRTAIARLAARARSAR